MSECIVRNEEISIAGLTLDQAHQIKMAIISYPAKTEDQEFNRKLVLEIDKAQDEVCRNIEIYRNLNNATAAEGVKLTRSLEFAGFSTDDFEKGKTKCGLLHKITSLSYDDNIPHFPTRSLGCIYVPSGSPIIAKWNLHGECTVQGKRLKAFDLIKPSQQKAVEKRRATLAFVGIVLILVSSFIWN
jgi:hypothetical protein